MWSCSPPESAGILRHEESRDTVNGTAMPGGAEFLFSGVAPGRDEDRLAIDRLVREARPPEIAGEVVEAGEDPGGAAGIDPPAQMGLDVGQRDEVFRLVEDEHVVVRGLDAGPDLGQRRFELPAHGRAGEPEPIERPPGRVEQGLVTR